MGDTYYNFGRGTGGESGSGTYARAYFTVSGGIITPGSSSGFSSIIRISAGLYEFTFDTPTDDINYTVIASGEDGGPEIFTLVDSNTLRTTSSFRVKFSNDGATLVDVDAVNVAVFTEAGTGAIGPDVLLIKGTSTAPASAYIESSTPVHGTYSEVWTSYTIPATNGVDWSDALPTPIVSTQYSKTKIVGESILSVGGSDQEETIEYTIIIDWGAGTVKGYWTALLNSSGISNNGSGYFDGVTDATVVGTNTQGGVSVSPVIETSSRTITKLPTYTSVGRSHSITITNLN